MDARLHYKLYGWSAVGLLQVAMPGAPKASLWRATTDAQLKKGRNACKLVSKQGPVFLGDATEGPCRYPIQTPLGLLV